MEGSELVERARPEPGWFGSFHVSYAAIRSRKWPASRCANDSARPGIDGGPEGDGDAHAGCP